MLRNASIICVLLFSAALAYAYVTEGMYLGLSWSDWRPAQILIAFIGCALTWKLGSSLWIAGTMMIVALPNLFSTVSILQDAVTGHNVFVGSDLDYAMYLASLALPLLAILLSLMADGRLQWVERT